MIPQSDYQDGANVLGTMMAGLLAAIDPTTGTPAALCNYAASDIISNAQTIIQSGNFTPLLEVFDDALAANVSITGLENLRQTLIALAQPPAIEVPGQTTISELGITLINAGVQLVLYAECSIYQSTTFTSRQDVQAAVDQLRSAFAPSIAYCSQVNATNDFQALIRAQAAIIAFLNQTARPLPNMIQYSVSRVMTSYQLALYLYGDASHAGELVLENKVANPAFMPLQGNALSS